MDKTQRVTANRPLNWNGDPCARTTLTIAGSGKPHSGLVKPAQSGPVICVSLMAALALSACAGGHQTAKPEAMDATPKILSADAVPAPTPAPTPAAGSTASMSTDAMGSKVQSAQAQLPDDESVAEAPQTQPDDASRTIIETTTVVEEPTSVVETTEIVETSDAIAERRETVTTTERIVDRVEVDAQQGRVTETVDVEVSAQKTTDIVVVDKQTGETMETVVQSAPVVKETGHIAMTVETQAGPKDPSRRFTGPDGIDLLPLAGYGVVAAKSETLVSDRNRLVMICKAFAAPTPGLDEMDRPAAAPGMITAWPISSTAHADELDNAAAAPDCAEAVERYGASEGMKALRDVERSGWFLEDRGPFLLAWSPPLAKGSPGAPVLLADLSRVTTPDAALAVMHRWAMDVEANTALWNEGRWDSDRLRPVIERWNDEFGPRVLMLLGPVGG